jgi:GT2 family glycosyltransferase
MESNKSGFISIILCHHTGELIYECVKSIRKSKNIEYEIIIVSSDPELNIPDARIITSNEGPAEKRNLGALFAKGDYLAFFDDDTTLMPYCLYEMRNAINDEVKMVYSKLLTMGTNKFDDAGSFIGNWGFLIERSLNVEDKGQFDYKCLILAGKSASCMIEKKTFFKIGGFDRSFFMFGEETDLSWRSWLAGYKVMFIPTAVTYHAFNTSLKDIKKFYSQKTVHYHGSKNYITMLIKNLEWRNLLWILPKHIFVWLLMGFIFVLKAEFLKAGYIFQGIFYNLKHFGVIRRKKAYLNAIIRTKYDKDIFPYIFRAAPFTYYLKRFFTYARRGRTGR